MTEIQRIIAVHGQLKLMTILFQTIPYRERDKKNNKNNQQQLGRMSKAHINLTTDCIYM